MGKIRQDSCLVDSTFVHKLIFLKSVRALRQTKAVSSLRLFRPCLLPPQRPPHQPNLSHHEAILLLFSQLSYSYISLSAGHRWPRVCLVNPAPCYFCCTRACAGRKCLVYRTGKKKSQVYFGKAEIHDVLSKIHEATSQTHRRGWRSRSDALEIRRLHLKLVEVGWCYLRRPDGLGRK